MFLFFNKEYRKFNAILSDLLNKVKKSPFLWCSEGHDAVYETDTVVIYFKLESYELVVKDRTGSEIISLDCHYDRYDELQNAKWHLFSDFLKEVRNTYDKRIEKESKFKDATEKANKEAEAKQKVISAQAAKEKMLNDALTKLRGL